MTPQDSASAPPDDGRTDALAMVAHDLLTPLTSIVGFADLLLRDAERPGGEQEREFALRIRTKADEMQVMVEELIETVRLGATPATALDIQPCDLGIVAREAAESVALGDRHELRVEVIGGLPPVACDASRISRVVANLVANAVKFSPDGGPVVVSIEATESSANISVTDTGVGVDGEDVERIFERFAQAGEGDRQGSGFGLGLFVVKALVEAHGGRVTVVGAVGEGSTFTVELPVEGPKR